MVRVAAPPRPLVTSALARAAPDPRWPVSSAFRDHRIESSAILQQQGHSHDLLPDLAHQFVPLLSRQPAYVPAELPARSAGRPDLGPQGQLRESAIRQIAVLGVSGRPGDVEDLDRAVQVSLAEGPRGVVCDLSAVLEGPEPGAIEMLAAAGRHARNGQTRRELSTYLHELPTASDATITTHQSMPIHRGGKS
jgi:hypothetical protein